MKIAWALVLLSICACSNGGGSSDAGADSGDGGQPPSTCASDNDCPTLGQHCYFVIDGGCTIQNLKGVCMAFTIPDKCAPNVGCGCDGTTISVCAPAGYVDRSSSFAGACPADGGTDAGNDAAEADASDASPE